MKASLGINVERFFELIERLIDVLAEGPHRSLGLPLGRQRDKSKTGFEERRPRFVEPLILEPNFRLLHEQPNLQTRIVAAQCSEFSPSRSVIVEFDE